MTNDPFSRCIQSVASRIGLSAIYIPSVGESFNVMLVRVPAGDVFEMHGERLMGGSNLFEVAASFFNIQPQRGDQISILGVVYEVKSDPIPDIDALIYTFDCFKK